MTEFNSHETHNIHPDLNYQEQFRLNKIKEIKDYFIAEIKKRELAKSFINTLLLLTILISH